MENGYIFFKHKETMNCSSCFVKVLPWSNLLPGTLRIIEFWLILAEILVNAIFSPHPAIHLLFSSRSTKELRALLLAKLVIVEAESKVITIDSLHYLKPKVCALTMQLITSSYTFYCCTPAFMLGVSILVSIYIHIWSIHSNTSFCWTTNNTD